MKKKIISKHILGSLIMSHYVGTKDRTVQRPQTLLGENMPSQKVQFIDICGLCQGRIYVANEYPTFARTISMVGQKLTFSRQISLNVRQNLSVLMKNMQILGKKTQILEFFSTLL